MKQKLSTRILSLVLALCLSLMLSFTVVPINGFAANGLIDAEKGKAKIIFESLGYIESVGRPDRTDSYWLDNNGSKKTSPIVTSAAIPSAGLSEGEYLMVGFKLSNMKNISEAADGLNSIKIVFQYNETYLSLVETSSSKMSTNTIYRMGGRNDNQILKTGYSLESTAPEDIADKGMKAYALNVKVPLNGETPYKGTTDEYLAILEFKVEQRPENGAKKEEVLSAIRTSSQNTINFGQGGATGVYEPNLPGSNLFDIIEFDDSIGDLIFPADTTQQTGVQNWTDPYANNWDLANEKGNFTSELTESQLPTMETVLLQKEESGEFTEVTKNTTNVTGTVYVGIKAKNFDKYVKNNKGAIMVTTALVFDKRYLTPADTTKTDLIQNADKNLKALGDKCFYNIKENRTDPKNPTPLIGSYSIPAAPANLNAKIETKETSPVSANSDNLQKITYTISYSAEDENNEDELGAIIEEGSYLAIYTFTVNSDPPKDKSLGVALSRSGGIGLILGNGSSGFNKSYAGTGDAGLHKYLKLVDGVNLFPAAATKAEIVLEYMEYVDGITSDPWEEAGERAHAPIVEAKVPDNKDSLPETFFVGIKAKNFNNIYESDLGMFNITLFIKFNPAYFEVADATQDMTDAFANRLGTANTGSIYAVAEDLAKEGLTADYNMGYTVNLSSVYLDNERGELKLPIQGTDTTVQSNLTGTKDFYLGVIKMKKLQQPTGEVPDMIALLKDDEADRGVTVGFGAAGGDEVYQWSPGNNDIRSIIKFDSENLNMFPKGTATTQQPLGDYDKSEGYSNKRADLYYEYLGTTPASQDDYDSEEDQDIAYTGTLKGLSNQNDFQWEEGGLVWIGIKVKNMSRLRTMMNSATTSTDTAGVASFALSIAYDTDYFELPKSNKNKATTQSDRILNNVTYFTNRSGNKTYEFSTEATNTYSELKKASHATSIRPLTIEQTDDKINILKLKLNKTSSTETNDRLLFMDGAKMYGGNGETETSNLADFPVTDAETLLYVIPLKMKATAPQAGQKVLEGYFDKLNSAMTVGTSASGFVTFDYEDDPDKSGTIGGETNLRNRFNITSKITFPISANQTGVQVKSGTTPTLTFIENKAITGAPATIQKVYDGDDSADVAAADVTYYYSTTDKGASSFAAEDLATGFTAVNLAGGIPKLTGTNYLYASDGKFAIKLGQLTVTGAHTASMMAQGEVDGALSIDDGVAYKPYKYQIIMTDGNDKYTFKKPLKAEGYDPGEWPVGLEISPTGEFSGTVTSANVFIDVRVLVTSKEDNTQKYLTCKVTFVNRPVVAAVRGGTFPYDGNPHAAEAEFYDEEGNKLDITPIVTYANNEDTKPPVNVGSYLVFVTSPSGCTITNNVTATITITPADAPSITIRDKTVPYTGAAQGIDKSEVTLIPANVEFVIEYQYPGSTEYTETKPTASGRYNVRVRTTDRNFPLTYAYATFTISPKEIDFTVSPVSVTYTGEKQEPEVVAVSDEEIAYTVSYTDKDNNPISGKPEKAGTYNIVINFDNPDRYSVGEITSRTFTIEKKEVIFTIDQKTYSYKADEDNKTVEQIPVVKPSLEGFTKYTVQYQRLSEDGNPVGEPANYISETGRYNVIYTLTDPDNYTFGTGSTRSVSIADKILNFKFENLTVPYKRDTVQGAKVDVTTEGDLIESHYSVVYTQNNDEVEPINVGRYAIEIRPIHGHGVGTMEPEDPYFTITQQEVTFSVAEGEATSAGYDGKGHTVSVTPNAESDIIDEYYTVKYRNKATNIETDAAQDAGEYDIVVNVKNSNYKAVENIIGTFTVNTTYKLRLGNSPAAMIFKDEIHANDSEWQQNVFNEFITNRKFSAENYPASCTPDVKYSIINELDLDGDVNTVIVKNINDFDDPGIVINGVEQQGNTPEPVDGVEGLYRVAYNVEGQTLYRYVMVVKTKIGDTSGDGYVNAIDANYLDKKDGVVNGVTEARIWDVNKDGTLNRDDADAIRNRFRTALVPYYAWVK